MIGSIVLTERGATPRIAKRKQGQITKAMLAETAANHHAKFMHKHFTVAGGREYGYKPRKGEGKSGRDFWRSYTGRKKREKGHTRPLEFSGASKTLAKIRDVRATRNRARLVQHARGLNRRNPHSDIRMQDEIRAISEPEVRAAMQFAEQSLQRQYAEIQTSKRTRLR